ncbi:MAG: tryptophan synthase subunit alpha [Gallionellales bacterium 35-53-114]|jgi:tryptophan synthase alpha chain|nr:MAG: tryptophan synthase subunit alpha [Gallionellales bacterium 35-53-114]OYZ62813.1 MAG: tryptophan synthase subunit alpha [Gallionellales bacterium 24-53-125]OZB09888.1 MAG: tryptophan synthase subunit alpha [Gallionellales bacterium 39-52-133]HQS57544.1 tryptophan synthase subunit alpha [Gallionellaceae bacterium]HQS73998.1 tryptophan synthase subunit alpha [Gallionellaceae bacterium]
MSRIENKFTALKKQGRKALIPFVTAGDPDPKVTVPLMHALVAAGADVLELGVPFSDPMADGPVIQRASERALKHHVGLRDVLQMVAEFRSKDTATPVVLMGYGNPIEAMGWKNFAQRCAEVGVDGVLTVDFPPEESHDAFEHLQAHGIAPIFLIAPTTNEARIALVAKLARGYVYYVSLKGVTGAGNLDLSDIAQKIPQLRKHISIPIGVGFGIRDAETARAVSALCDGVVVGSRIVQEIENSKENKMLENVSTLVKGLRQAIDSGN